MARFANYANLFDKVSRMVNSKMWAAPLWYQGARRAPPPVLLRWPKPPVLKLPEMELYTKVAKRIPVLRLEQEFGGRNPYTTNEKSLAWKFAKRQYQYMKTLKLSEDEAFERTSSDLDPEIHDMVSALHKQPEDKGQHEFLIGTGLENEEWAQPRMRESSTLSVHSIRANIAAAKANATVARARKRKEGQVPTSSDTCQIMEEKLLSSREATPLDPLYGPPSLAKGRARVFTRQITEFGIESVQRRFVQKPSPTHEALQAKLKTPDGSNINNPTAEYLANRILPDAKEAKTFREAVEADEEAYSKRLAAMTDLAAAVGLQELPMSGVVKSLADMVLQADKLRAFRKIVLEASSQAQGIPAGNQSLIGKEAKEQLKAFVEEWKNQDILKKRKQDIQKELNELDGDAAETEWQQKQADLASSNLQRDVYGKDQEAFDWIAAAPHKYQGMIRELQQLTNNPSRAGWKERDAKRRLLMK